MGKHQLPLFQPPPLTDAERTDAIIVAGRAERSAREATRPSYRDESSSRRERLRADIEAALKGTPAPAVASSVPPAAESEVRPKRDESARSRRKRDVRARTMSVKRMTKRELELGRLLNPDVDESEGLVAKPTSRAECDGVPRPCPFVSCRHHLYLDVSARTGAIKLNFPDLEVHELPADASCALDVADLNGVTLERSGEIMNLTRERIRQVEVKALAKMKAAHDTLALRDFHGDEGPIGKRRLPVLQADHDEEDGDDGFQGDEQPDRETSFNAAEFASEALDAE